ncbi:MAG: helix-turn-helix domain-containing protein [Pseudomonadota bacterium]
MGNLNQVELAERWDLSPRTLEQWRWRGVGPRYLKIGGRVLYPLAEVEAYETARLHQNTSGPLPQEG